MFRGEEKEKELRRKREEDRRSRGKHGIEVISEEGRRKRETRGGRERQEEKKDKKGEQISGRDRMEC